MVATRRSTRQPATAAPKYNEESFSSTENSASERNSARATRRKRARSDDHEVADEIALPPRKLVTASSKSSQTHRIAKSETIKKQSVPPVAPSSDSNRDANGNQEVFWLLKAEPLPRYENGINVAFSIDDLVACTKPEPWGGVRNPQARNNMQAMRKGDLGFFYHSNAKPSGVVGILRVVEEAKVDETAFDSKDPYYDPKSKREDPKWFCVAVEYVQKFNDVVDLHKIKDHAKDGGPLKDMQLVTNSRLSVCKVRKQEWEFILDLAGEKAAD
ncbi:hypothetical protein ACN47E_007529 [Coniothyrium glycines]